MYDPVNTTSGVAAVADFFSNLAVTSAPDGLQMAPKSPAPLGHVVFPVPLLEWLRDLRLLRRISLSYLVPDARLLPPESIRFFHVDYTWVDRVIDGVYSAANLGTVDATFTYGSLKGVRDALDDDLEALAKTTSTSPWRPGKDHPMTGCLIRSELIRRWPGIIVAAFGEVDKGGNGVNPLAILRAETISTDVYIALFGGQPALVQIREPHVGTRFGVEANETVDRRDRDGDKLDEQGNKISSKEVPATLSVSFRDPNDPNNRTLDIAALSTRIANFNPRQTNRARMVALQLEQPAYLQNFVNNPGVTEAQGSVSPITLVQANQGSTVFKLNRGKTMSLDKFVTRLAEAEQQRKP